MRDTTPAPAHVVDNLQSKLGRSHVLRFFTALLLALVTWGWVTQATDPISRTVYSEVEIDSPTLSSDLVMVTTLPRASVTVEGPRSDVSQINRSMVSLQIDTSGVTAAGEYRLPLVADVPDTGARVSVEPSFVHVQIDELTSRVMPIQVRQTSAETSTRVVSNVVPAVSQVTVSGPSSAVDRVDAVILPVTFENQTTSVTSLFVPFAVDENDQLVTEVTILPEQIMTQVELKSTGKVLSVIPSITGQPADGYSTLQRTVLPSSITVDGPADALADLLFVNTEPVDITGASQSVSQRVGIADLPAGVTILEPASGQVEVRVAVEDTSATSQTLSNLPVNALNVPDGYEVTIQPETVDVSVQGTVSTLSGMTSDDITVVVDIRGLEAGTHIVTPVVALPDNAVISNGTSPASVEESIVPVGSPNPSPEFGTPTTYRPAHKSEDVAHDQRDRRMARSQKRDLSVPPVD